MKKQRSVYRNLWSILSWAWGAVALLLPSSLLACYEPFPNTILDHPDEALRSMPEANFSAEIEALRIELVTSGAIANTNWEVSAFACEDSATETLLADEADLTAALAAGPSPFGERLPTSMVDSTPLLAGLPDERACNYAVFRVCLSQMQLLRAASSMTRPLFGVGDTVHLEPPPGLPKEFDLYGRGAVAYHLGDLPTARRYWVEVLTLPPANRRYRSTWSAYMLGRSWQDEQPDRAIECFRLVRTLAASAFHDSLGLALASLGWEARIELNRGLLERVASLYMEQYAEGDPLAMVSLQWVAGQLFSGYAHRLPEFAADPLLQRLATAYLVSRGEPGQRPSDEDSKRWLAAVQKAGGKGMAGTDRLAWLAYQRGDMDTAQQWLDHAPTQSITARWLSAKLLLRQGRKQEAQTMLTEVTRDTDAAAPETLPSYAVTDAVAGDRPGSRPAGELAALLMSEGRYVEALDLLWRHGWWTDASYVAERVLSLDELRRYVDAHCPEPEKPAAPKTADHSVWDGYSHPMDLGWCQAQLRYILARRLARTGAFETSLAYYPPPWRSRMEEYWRRLQTGRNTALPEVTRAAALWRAAQIARYWGMELLGTEVAPDWHLYDGNYQFTYVDDRMPTNRAVLAAASSDEVRRVTSQVPRFGERFHYRYIAAEHAWAAACLMPDNSRATAWVLCQAGLWLKERDPKAADRFYKALVRRCGATDLGREAKTKRWFPKIQPMDHAWSRTE